MFEVLLTKQAERWLLKLPAIQRKEILILIKMLEKLGHELELPHSRHIKCTREKIKELRCTRYGNRLYYVYQGDKIYIGLLGGNKTSQRKDIKKADKIAKILTQK